MVDWALGFVVVLVRGAALAGRAAAAVANSVVAIISLFMSVLPEWWTPVGRANGQAGSKAKSGAPARFSRLPAGSIARCLENATLEIAAWWDRKPRPSGPGL
jgi:hypothetical protein